MQAGSTAGIPVGRTAVSAILAPVGRTALSAILSMLLRNLIPVLVLLLLLTSCGMFTGTPHATRRAVGTAYMPPTAGELEAALTAELIRLGKSPSDSTPHAPAGSTNAVFDLACSVVDPDGEPDGEGGGELPPTGISLCWTERLLGDYNLDGQVNAGDLAPLGINWQQAVQYDAAALHGGIAYWPQGSAVDDGGSPYPAPPAQSSGARNWRLARIDAQSDGVLDVKDVTPIAVHWCEQSSGYRIYVKLPGGTEFLLVPEDGATPHQPAAGEVTLPRTAAFPAGKNSADPTRPVRFGCTYEDGGHGGPPHGLPEGRYEYYVAAYDAATDSEGPASAHVVMDITGGVANQPPVAVLTVSPDFAGAPAVITFDASQSHDPDGSIKEYRWDFDADGVVDWSTADETVPEQSSGGEVDTITPGEAPGAGLPPASVTVTYHQGHAQYLYPRVTVVDDDEAVNTRSAKLGVTGWVRELISSEDPAHDPPGQEVQFVVRSVGANPITGEVACCGEHVQDGIHYGDQAFGLYYAYRKSSGEWVQELACGLDNPALTSWDANAISLSYIAWQADGQPVIAFVAGQVFAMDFITKVLLAERQASGTWNVSLWLEGSGSVKASFSSVRLQEPGRFIALGQLKLDNTTYYYLLGYNNGPQPPEDTGISYHWEDGGATDDPLPKDMFVNPSGETCILMALSAYIDPWGVNTMRRTAPGVWVPERLVECTDFPLDTWYLGTRKVFFQPDGNTQVVAAPGIAGDTSRHLIGYASGKTNLSLQVLHEGYTIRNDQVCMTNFGISVIGVGYLNPGYSFIHDLISDTGIITEYIQDQLYTPTNLAALWATGSGPGSRLYATLTVQGGSFPNKDLVFLTTRVDPRIGP